MLRIEHLTHVYPGGVRALDAVTLRAVDSVGAKRLAEKVLLADSAAAVRDQLD